MFLENFSVPLYDTRHRGTALPLQKGRNSSHELHYTAKMKHASTTQPHLTQIVFSGLGGHTAVSMCLVRELRVQGIESSLLFHGVEPLLEQTRLVCEAENILFAYVPKRAGVDFYSIWALYRQLCDWRPTAVLSHGPNTGLSAFPYALLHSAKWLVRETHANHLKGPKDFVASFFGLLLADHVILLTQEYRHELLSLFCNVGGKRARVIGNALDLRLYYPSSYSSARSRRIRLGMVSRFTPIKDHKTLLQAIALLPTELQINMDLLLAGQGGEKEALDNLCAELNIQGVVHFVGLLNEAEIARFLRSLDLYVHATLGETMSNSLMQAMATGLAIVASDVPGVSNMFVHNQTARLVPPNQPEQWAQALCDLISDKDSRRKLGQAARLEAESRYSSQCQAAEYRGLLE